MSMLPLTPITFVNKFLFCYIPKLDGTENKVLTNLEKTEFK